jgi:RNAse (barnase) inhibitor barstar
MENFKFIDNTDYNYSSTLFVANIRTTIGKSHLLKTLSEELDFPDYFGCNWDALWDCITDLEWISQKYIILVHNNLPSLSNHDLKIYLEILDKTVVYWNDYESHSLEVVFPTRVKNELKYFYQQQCMHKDHP